MLVTLLPMVALFRLVQNSNAEFPMLVMLFGIVTPVRLAQNSNAESPILVIGSPLVVSGIVTAPPVPVYLVMVTVPLLVVKSNWACTGVDSIKSSNRSSLVAQAAPKRPATVFGRAVLAMEACVSMVFDLLDAARVRGEMVPGRTRCAGMLPGRGEDVKAEPTPWRKQFFMQTPCRSFIFQALGWLRMKRLLVRVAV